MKSPFASLLLTVLVQISTESALAGDMTAEADMLAPAAGVRLLVASTKQHVIELPEPVTQEATAKATFAEKKAKLCSFIDELVVSGHVPTGRELRCLGRWLRQLLKLRYDLELFPRGADASQKFMLHVQVAQGYADCALMIQAAHLETEAGK